MGTLTCRGDRLWCRCIAQRSRGWRHTGGPWARETPGEGSDCQEPAARMRRGQGRGNGGCCSHNRPPPGRRCRQGGQTGHGHSRPHEEHSTARVDRPGCTHDPATRHTVLWPSAQVKGAHPTWPSRQNGVHWSESQGRSSGQEVCATYPGGGWWRERLQCTSEAGGHAQAFLLEQEQAAECLQRVEDLLQQVAEEEFDSLFQAQPAVDPQPMAKQPKTPPTAHTEGREANNAEEWKLAMARTCRRKRLPPRPEVPLQNLSPALQTEKERPVTSGETLELSKAVQSARCMTASATNKRQRMVAVGNCLLRSTEAPICWPATLSREVCCLSGMSPRNYQASYSLLTVIIHCCCFHVGTSDTARSSLRSIKKDYRVLGADGKGLWSTGRFFPSVLPDKGKGFERSGQIWWINKWLQNWCYSQGFNYLDHGTYFEKPGLRWGLMGSICQRIGERASLVMGLPSWWRGL